MERYMDTTLTARERAELLLKEMTLDEKIAQLTGVFSLKGYEDKMAAFFKNGIGQISTLGFRTCESMEEAAAWQRSAYPGGFPHGGPQRRVYPGYHLLPLRREPRRGL